MYKRQSAARTTSASSSAPPSSRDLAHSGALRLALPAQLASAGVPTLSETDSKALLRAQGLPVADERVVSDVDAAVEAAGAVGYPVVVKLGGDAIAHKTERGLVRLGLADGDAVRSAAAELLAVVGRRGGEVHLLVVVQPGDCLLYTSPSPRD